MKRAKRKCTIGYSCGYGCINTEYICNSQLGPKASVLFSQYRKKAKLKQDVEANSLFASIYSESARQKYKDVKTMHPEFNNAEAMGMAAWVGGKYSAINKSLLGIEPSPFGDRAGANIKSALAKLPGPTESALYDVAEASNATEQGKAKIAKYIEKKTTGDNYALSRNIRIPEPETFLAENKMLEGNTYVLDHLFATSFDDDLTTFAGNVEFKIDAPIDGTSKGKAIDDIKTSRWESELLFPQGSTFSIDKIAKKVPSQAEVKLPKIKAKKSQDFMQNMLLDLASKEPSALLNTLEPDFSQLSKADSKKMAKLFRSLTNYKYTIYLTEQLL